MLTLLPTNFWTRTKGEYKNKTGIERSRNMTFIKDLMAFLSLATFSVAALTWADLAVAIAQHM